MKSDMFAALLVNLTMMLFFIPVGGARCEFDCKSRSKHAGVGFLSFENRCDTVLNLPVKTKLHSAASVIACTICCRRMWSFNYCQCNDCDVFSTCFLFIKKVKTCVYSLPG